MVDDLQRLTQSYNDSPKMYYWDTLGLFLQADFDVREVEGYLRYLVAKKTDVGDRAFTASLSDKVFKRLLRTHNLGFTLEAFDEIRGWRNVFAHCVFVPSAMAERLDFHFNTAGAMYYLERGRKEQVAHVEKVLGRLTPPIKCARCNNDFVGGCQCKCIPMYLGRSQMEQIAEWVKLAKHQLIDQGLNIRFNISPTSTPTD